MAETTEAEATNEWQSFDDDQAFLSHILNQKPAEEIVEIPEWHVKVLCRALNAETRIKIQMAAYDDKTKRTDYRNVFHMVVLEGCHNPATGHKIFTESHRTTIMRNQDGGAIERLAIAVLRVSGMLVSDADRTKKN